MSPPKKTRVAKAFARSRDSLRRHALGTSIAANLDASESFFMEARFRVLDIIGIGAFIDVLDGTNRYSAFFFPTGVQLAPRSSVRHAQP